MKKKTLKEINMHKDDIIYKINMRPPKTQAGKILIML